MFHYQSICLMKNANGLVILGLVLQSSHFGGALIILVPALLYCHTERFPWKNKRMLIFYHKNTVQTNNANVTELWTRSKPFKYCLKADTSTKFYILFHNISLQCTSSCTTWHYQSVLRKTYFWLIDRSENCSSFALSIPIFYAFEVPCFNLTQMQDTRIQIKRDPPLQYKSCTSVHRKGGSVRRQHQNHLNTFWQLYAFMNCMSMQSSLRKSNILLPSLGLLDR